MFRATAMMCRVAAPDKDVRDLTQEPRSSAPALRLFLWSRGAIWLLALVVVLGFVAALGWLLLGHYLLAGVLVSLGAGSAAFVLLYRLTCLRLGEEAARRTVLFLAVAPTSLFFGAVYSESLFLLLAVATFLLAERG